MNPEKQELLRKYAVLVMTKNTDEISKFLQEHGEDPEILMGCQVINEVSRNMKASGPITSFSLNDVLKHLKASAGKKEEEEEEGIVADPPKAEEPKKSSNPLMSGCIGLVLLFIAAFFVGVWGALVALGYKATMHLVLGE